ncbi:MAG: hypothetical protein U0531_18140 [Dehalococcoidia bacterium]
MQQAMRGSTPAALARRIRTVVAVCGAVLLAPFAAVALAVALCVAGVVCPVRRLARTIARRCAPDP